MRITLELRAAAALAFALGLDAVAASPPPQQGLALSACEIEHPLLHTVVAAECGALSVAENPRDPAGRHIALAVARVPAISRRKQPDPLFILAGGPGQAASDFYTTAAGAFTRIHRERDIILLDQRGTGRSNRLDCPEDEEHLYHASGAEIAAATRRCLGELRAHADVAWYTTSVAVEDLERVRASLGLGRINLYGTSYGTRVAQQYLRRFPDRVRSVMLDGVVPPQLAMGAELPEDAERALLDVLGRCAAQPPCRSRFGDPVRAYRSVRAALARRAVPVSVPDPSTGAPQRFDFGTEQLATVLRLGSYSADYAALLPLLLDEAASRGDYAPLGAQFLLVERSYAEGLATGMHNSVVCAEDVPFYGAAGIDRARLADTLLGTVQLDALETVCGIWPHGPVDPEFHAPLVSEVPALLLSGGDDPVTPPAFAEMAARGFRHHLSIVLPGFGHGALTAPCIDRVMAQFLARASSEGLDVGCTRAAEPPPFFTSLNGPSP
ncbi:MAG TPA: alpha/beta fold hydrolase [Steroidobacteraceae bacterium]|nr:alpha/beta fold hydrolase [Steroidobacteraceae bacterium]